jgi:hypothetical protein
MSATFPTAPNWPRSPFHPKLSDLFNRRDTNFCVSETPFSPWAYIKYRENFTSGIVENDSPEEVGLPKLDCK